ncbi:MAG: VCBS repeat-containing protein, partial [Deltaproteobacteria bacterium]
MKHKERVKDFHGIFRGRSFYLYISALLILLLSPTDGNAISWEVAHVKGGLDYRNVATGDFNNDGRQDVIAVGANGADIWLQGLYFPCPAAVWSDGCYYSNSIAGDYIDVTVADFNNDGNLDFVAVGESGIDVIMLGDGDPDGDFLISWTDASGIFSGQYKSVEVFDYKNDGDMDIIAAGAEGFYLWENTDPTGPDFGPIPISSIDNYNKITLTDFNNDALMDIVAARDAGGVDVWFGNGPPGWSFAAQSDPVSTGRYLSVAAADLDLDGNSDIVAGSEYGISVWYGNGKGSWLTQTTKYPGTTLPTEEDIYQAVTIADVDRDRYPDIIGAQAGGGVLVWFGDQDHLWVAQTSVFISGNYLGVSVIDYYIDGLLDVVSVSPNSMKVSLQIREAEVMPLQWLRGASGSASVTGYQGVDSADFNRDGVPDVIAAKNDGGVHIWLGKRGGGWVKAITESSPPSPASVGQYYDVAAADLNNDGLIDVAASHNSGEGVKVWLGQFSSTTGTATGGGPSSLVDAAKSWTPDEWFGYQLTITSGIGKGQTRVVKSNTGNTLITYSNWNIIPSSGDGYSLRRYFWSPETGPTALENHYHLAAADMNHDGRKDLIAGSDN